MEYIAPLNVPPYQNHKIHLQFKFQMQNGLIKDFLLSPFIRPPFLANYNLHSNLLQVAHAFVFRLFRFLHTLVLLWSYSHVFAFTGLIAEFVGSYQCLQKAHLLIPVRPSVTNIFIRSILLKCKVLFRTCRQSFAFWIVFIMYPDSAPMTLLRCSGNHFVINCR